MKAPKSGDMVRIAIGEIFHYGIYVSDKEIVQFGLPPVNKNLLFSKDIKVLSTDIETFISGGFLEVCELSFLERIRAKKSSDVVKYAEGKIGSGGYNLLYNNCEHFVNECVFGVKKCSQVDDVRAIVQNIPKTDIYYYIIPKEVRYDKVTPKARLEEIESCGSSKVKMQKYCVWQLLSFALNKSFNVDIQNCDITKNKNGKWVCPNCNISLSHNDKYAVVALSNHQVGVDVESVSNIRFNQKLLEKIATKNERQIDYSSKNLAILWTRKESIFKRENKKSFIPKDIDTLINRAESYSLDKDNIISISCDNFENINFYQSTFEKEFSAEIVHLTKEEI